MERCCNLPCSRTMPCDQPSRDEATAEIRILTYNVHGCIGTDRRLDPRRIADVIAACDPDIVALQELDVGRRRSGWTDQAVIIAGYLAMDSHFHAALHLEEEEYGDAILSRFPSRLLKAAALPSIGEPRGALAVSITVQGVQIVVVNTHLGLRRRERVRQVEELLGPAWLGHPQIKHRPAILMGDFNAVPNSIAYRRLAQHLVEVQAGSSHRDKVTFPSRLPFLRLDHIFLHNGLAVLGAEVVRKGLARQASDHLPVLARIAVPLDR